MSLKLVLIVPRIVTVPTCKCHYDKYECRRCCSVRIHSQSTTHHSLSVVSVIILTDICVCLCSLSSSALSPRLLEASGLVPLASCLSPILGHARATSHSRVRSVSLSPRSLSLSLLVRGYFSLRATSLSLSSLSPLVAPLSLSLDESLVASLASPLSSPLRRGSARLQEYTVCAMGSATGKS